MGFLHVHPPHHYLLNMFFQARPKPDSLAMIIFPLEAPRFSPQSSPQDDDLVRVSYYVNVQIPKPSAIILCL